jgi:hypothetical protein
MLTLPGMIVRRAILLGLLLGAARHGVAATTWSTLTIGVRVRPVVAVADAATLADGALRSPGGVVDARGAPLPVPVYFLASAPSDVRWVTVLADASPATGTSPSGAAAAAAPAAVAASRH